MSAVNSGTSPIIEPERDEIIARAVRSVRLRATTEGPQAVLDSDASFVWVGTPCDDIGTVGLKQVRAVCADIGVVLKQKQSFHSVIIRSSMVRGTMEEVCVPALVRLLQDNATYTPLEAAGAGFDNGVATTLIDTAEVPVAAGDGKEEA